MGVMVLATVALFAWLFFGSMCWNKWMGASSDREVMTNPLVRAHFLGTHSTSEKYAYYLVRSLGVIFWPVWSLVYVGCQWAANDFSKALDGSLRTDKAPAKIPKP